MSLRHRLAHRTDLQETLLVRLTLIDNRDSFTWNVVQLLSSLGAECTVLRSDQASLQDVRGARPQRLVLSPGPHRPEHATLSLEVLQEFAGQVPLLGVCLGHQCMASLFGGKKSVIHAALPMHGKTSSIFHHGNSIFRGVPSPFLAARYHSLIVKTVPKGFMPLAWTGSQKMPNELMAMSDPVRRLVGVQFHPESFLTEHGALLLKNFLTDTW